MGIIMVNQVPLCNGWVYDGMCSLVSCGR